MLVLESLEKAEVEVADELLGKALSQCMRYLHTWGSDTPTHTTHTLVCPRTACQPVRCGKCAVGKVILRSCPAGRMEEGPGPLVPASAPGVLPPCPPRPCSPVGQLPARAPPGSPTQAKP